MKSSPLFNTKDFAVKRTLNCNKNEQRVLNLKNLGNKSYKNKIYTKAIEYYTNAINIYKVS